VNRETRHEQPRGRLLPTQDHISTMDTTVDHIESLDELRRFIYKALCQKENLLTDQFPMTEAELVCGNKVCGLLFLLRGPRNVRLQAIWAADRNVVYLYDVRGERYATLWVKNRLTIAEHGRKE
jgi:hypothetical protein